MKYVDEAAFQRRQSQTEDDNPPSPMMTQPDTSDTSAAGLKFNTPHTPPSNPLTPASPHNPGSQQSNFLQSPPSIRNPSPAPAPSQPAPSPGGTGFTAPSPVNPIGSVGSPFPSVQSPMAGSPSIVGGPRPSPRNTHGMPSPAGHPHAAASHPSAPMTASRLLPQRLWAGAHPTPLTLQAFDDLCKPAVTPSPGVGLFVPPTSHTLSPLNCFLGCLYLRRHIHSLFKQEAHVVEVPSTDPFMVCFKVELLTCRVSSRPENAYQSLHLKVEQDKVTRYYYTY